MIEKIEQLIKAYNESNITIIDGDSESSTVDYKIYKEQDYTINLVLKKATKYELVVSLEQNHKLVYVTNGFECEFSLYEDMSKTLDEEGLESYINKYFELIFNNVKTYKYS